MGPEGRIAVATELWDEVDAQQASIPISAEQMAELDRRNEDYERDPSRVTTWEAIKARLSGDTSSH